MRKSLPVPPLLLVLLALVLGLAPFSTTGAVAAPVPTAAQAPVTAPASPTRHFEAFTACFHPKDAAARAQFLAEDPAAYSRMVALEYEPDELAAGVRLEKESPAFVRYERRSIKAFDACQASTADLL